MYFWACFVQNYDKVELFASKLFLLTIQRSGKIGEITWLFSSFSPCTGSGWDGVKFLHSSLYAAVWCCVLDLWLKRC